MSEIGFPDKLWEGMPVVFQRFKNAKFTMEQMIVRFTKNWMAEKGYFDNIKARKFQSLSDEGSLGKIWVDLKDFIGIIETNSNNLVTKFKEYVDISTKELKDYELASKQVETDYLLIKKKKDTAIQEMSKKREKYVSSFKEWDEADGQSTQAKNEVGLNNPKTQKLSKLAAEKFTQKDNAELQYIESVKLVQGFEKEYDTKLADLLRKFEQLELQRVSSIQSHLQEFFTLWHDNTVKCAEVLKNCVIAVSNINPREDLVAFSNQNQTDSTHLPYQLATLCQRTHGPDIPSANHALPFVAGSPSSASTSTPLIVTRGQELQQQQGGGRSQGSGGRQQKSQGGVGAGADAAAGAGSGVQKQQQQQKQQQRTQEQGSIVVGTNEFVVARVLVAYKATSDTEANVTVGDTVMVIPDRTGQGWVYCLKQDGQGGYVPTDYVEITPQ